MRLYWVRDRIRKNHFHIFWEEGKKNSADYVTKHQPIWHHIIMRPRYVKSTQRNGTGRGCVGTTNPGGTRKPENRIKGTRNTTPLNLDNPRKEIWGLVPNRIRSQWPIGLNLPT